MRKKTSLLKNEKLKLGMLHLQEEHDFKIQILQCELAIKKKNNSKCYNLNSI